MAMMQRISRPSYVHPSFSRQDFLQDAETHIMKREKTRGDGDVLNSDENICAKVQKYGPIPRCRNTDGGIKLKVQGKRNWKIMKYRIPILEKKQIEYVLTADPWRHVTAISRLGKPEAQKASKCMKRKALKRHVPHRMRRKKQVMK